MTVFELEGCHKTGRQGEVVGVNNLGTESWLTFQPIDADLATLFLCGFINRHFGFDIENPTMLERFEHERSIHTGP